MFLCPRRKERNTCKSDGDGGIRQSHWGGNDYGKVGQDVVVSVHAAPRAYFHKNWYHPPAAIHIPRIHKVPSASSPQPISDVTAFLLPPQSTEDQGKYTVVFDMDKTLIYSTRERDPRKPTVFKDGVAHYLTFRPFISDLLQQLAGNCELVLWTAGNPTYGGDVMKLLDPQGLVKHRIYRSEAWFRSIGYIKDLRRLGRSMDHTLIIDDNTSVCRNNLDNAIVIDPFYGNPDDSLLAQLQDILNGLLVSQMPVGDYLAQMDSNGVLSPDNGAHRLTSGFRVDIY